MSESVACSNCSGEMLLDDKFCRHCGVSNEVKPAYCPQCENELKDDSKFCSNCGSSVRPSDAPSIKPAVTAKDDEVWNIDIREIFRQAGDRRRNIQEAPNIEDGINRKFLTEIPGEEIVDSAEEAYSKGESAFREWDYEKAVKYYSRAIELDYEDENYYRRRGLCYLLTDSEVKAVDDYTQAIRINPTRADNYVKRGRCYRHLQDIRAHEDLDTALKLDHGLAEAHYLLGTVWSNAGNHEEAIENFNNAILLNPVDPYPFFHRAWSYIHEGYLDSAIDDYGKAIDLHIDRDTSLEPYSEGWESHLLLELSADPDPEIQKELQKLGDLELRGRPYRQASASPSSRDNVHLGPAHFERGYIYTNQQNQSSKALNDFEWCIEQNYKRAWAMIWVGDIFYALGDLEKAKSQYTQQLDVDPEASLALTGLGKVAYMQDDYPTAIDFFSRAIAYEDYYEMRKWRGLVRYISGDYQGALEDYLSCIEQAPAEETWEYYQGCCNCYDALGQYEKAKDSLDKVFELGHGSKELASYQVELIQKLTH